MTAASLATARAAAVFGSCASDHFLNPLVGLLIEIPMTGILF
jgi:enolase